MMVFNSLKVLIKKENLATLPNQNRYRQLALKILVVVALTPRVALAEAPVEALVGFGMLEEGDDRVRPAAMVQGAVGEHWFGQGFLWGRRFAQVEERSLLLTGGYRTNVFNAKWFRAGVGGVALEERTVIHARGSQTGTESDASYNLGALISLHGVWDVGPVIVQVAWDSAIFPAGISAILLTTGRKQTLSLAAGARF